MKELRARVISQEKGIYKIKSGTDVKSASVSGKYRYEARTVADYPAVGDYVTAQWSADAGNAVITGLYPRKSCFIRKAAGTGKQEQVVAANIDTAFICMSLNNNFNIRRLERYLSVTYSSGATPVVVLTKSDLCANAARLISEVQDAAPGVDVLAISSLEGNYEAVMRYILPGKTVAFIGSSGVGKSTLINKLTGKDSMATHAIGNDDKGRHTTTHRELLALPNGAFVIDTPGMRELGMWDSDGGIDTAFADIEAFGMRLQIRRLHAYGRAGMRYPKSPGGWHAGRRTLCFLPQAENRKQLCGGQQPIHRSQAGKVQEHLQNQ